MIIKQDDINVDEGGDIVIQSEKPSRPLIQRKPPAQRKRPKRRKDPSENIVAEPQEDAAADAPGNGTEVQESDPLKETEEGLPEVRHRRCPAGRRNRTKMKKPYSKPQAVLEKYELNASIASGCTNVVNLGPGRCESYNVR